MMFTVRRMFPLSKINLVIHGLAHQLQGRDVRVFGFQMRELLSLLVQPLTKRPMIVGVQSDMSDVQIRIEIDVAATLPPALAEHITFVPDAVRALYVVEEHPGALLALQGLVLELKVGKLSDHLLQGFARDPHETGSDGGDLPQTIFLMKTVCRPAQREIPGHILEWIGAPDDIDRSLTEPDEILC